MSRLTIDEVLTTNRQRKAFWYTMNELSSKQMRTGYLNEMRKSDATGYRREVANEFEECEQFAQKGNDCTNMLEVHGENVFDKMLADKVFGASIVTRITKLLKYLGIDHQKIFDDFFAAHGITVLH